MAQKVRSGPSTSTLSGCTITGTWHQESASGPYQFVFTGGGEKFTGGWDYDGSAHAAALVVDWNSHLDDR